MSVHVRLPEQLADRLTDVADRLDVSRSYVAREAIERGLKSAAESMRAKVRRYEAADADPGADA